MSVYGGTMMPPHPPLAEAPGSAMYNGMHAADPAWNPILKLVPNSADNSDPQQVRAPEPCAPFLYHNKHTLLHSLAQLTCDEGVLLFTHT